MALADRLGVVLVLVLFGGGGKIPRLMKDLGQGITAFRKGLKENKESGEQTQTTADSNDKQGVIDRS